MNLIADFLSVLGAAGLSYCAVMMVLSLPVFPLREIVVTTPLQNTTEAQLHYAAHSSLTGNFFTVNLQNVRGAFEKLPWVRHAEVRRRWPATLELTLEEHKPVAYWRTPFDDEVRLVNREGEVFVASSNARLPEFSGPEGSAALLLARFHEFSEIVRASQREITRLSFSDRQAWQMKLDDGLIVELGREQPRRSLNERLQRFMQSREAVWAQAGKQLGGAPKVADLRYPNGFVLRSALPEAGEKGKS